MDLKLLQLNIFEGKYLENILAFLKKEDFDIICLQEVAGGSVSQSGEDNFNEIRKELGFNGLLNMSWKIRSDPQSYFGNAILYKQNLKVENARSIFMKPFEEFESPDLPNDWSRSAIFMDFTFDNQKITVGTTHLARGETPYDKPYKEEQANKLLDFLKTIKTPLILTGDFNLVPETKIINSFSENLRNLTVETKITNTLNPRTHKLKDKLPNGLAVDYIFVSDEIKVKEFKLIDQNLSDHLGLSLTFQV